MTYYQQNRNYLWKYNIGKYISYFSLKAKMIRIGAILDFVGHNGTVKSHNLHFNIAVHKNIELTYVKSSSMTYCPTLIITPKSTELTVDKTDTTACKI